MNVEMDEATASLHLTMNYLSQLFTNSNLIQPHEAVPHLLEFHSLTSTLTGIASWIGNAFLIWICLQTG